MTNASIQRIAANYVQRFLHVVEIGPILRRRHRGVYRQTPARAHRDHRAAEPENGVDLVQRHRGTLACLLFPVETHRRHLTRTHRTAALTGSANGYSLTNINWRSRSEPGRAGFCLSARSPARHPRSRHHEDIMRSAL